MNNYMPTNLTFIETYKIARLNHEETKNLNRLITSNEIVIKKLPINKIPDQVAAQVNSNKDLKKN